MKSYYKIFLWIFICSGIPTSLCSQNLTLSGDAKISLKSDGIVFSSPSIKLKDSSQIIHAENVTLTQKSFIEILSPKALIKTKVLEKGEAVSLSIGIASKSVLNLRPSANSVSYSIGMSQSEEDAALPFKWKISASSSNQERKTGIDFSWEKAIEPVDFDLKALLIQENGAWELPLNQQVGEGMVSLVDFSDFEQEGSFFTVKNFTRDADEDEVPDIMEIRESTDLKDPGSYLDSDGDGVPDYLEIADGTDPFDSGDFKDSEADGVPDYVGFRSPFAFLDLENVNIPWGLQNYRPLFQDSVLTMLGSGKLLKLPLNWNYQQLNIYARGSYPVTSKLEVLPRGIFNAFNKIPAVDGNVLPKPAPLDILLSNNSFDGAKTSEEIAIGTISVVDPVDSRHVPGVPHGLEDNRYFRVINDVLYWSSEDPAAGRTTFKIVIRVTDRDFNSLDKVFTIERSRKSVAGIEVFNSFSPNNDGNNDSWGVPDLRYYKNVRIQIFDRGGERMFYTENPDTRWDGTVNGKALPIGTYYWTIEVGETGEVRKGMLNLLRK